MGNTVAELEAKAKGKDYRRKGPLPPNHPLAGGRTVIFAKHRPNQRQVPQKGTTTPEEKAMLQAAFMMQMLIQQDVDAGLPPWTREKQAAFMRAKQKEYNESLKGENNGESKAGSGDTGEESGGSGSGSGDNTGENGTPEQPSLDSLPSTDGNPSDTDNSGEGEIPEPPVDLGGVPNNNEQNGQGEI